MVAARAGSKALIREINQALVLDTVRRHGTAARSEIVRDTGLSPATVTGITAHLVDAGLLSEQRTHAESRGRPARLLQLTSERVFAAGVQIAPDALDVVVVDLRGRVRAEHREGLDSSEPDSVADAVVGAVQRAFEVPGEAQILGIGLAISGVVDFDAGIVRHSGALGWQEVALGERLRRRTEGRVRVDNLVNCYGASRLVDEPALADEDVLILSVGTSIGASSVTSGVIRRGHLGSAGGFAHTRAVDGADGRPCHCGDVDCLEAWSSGWGMRKELERRDGAATTQSVRAEAGRQFGAAAANAAKLLGPQRVIAALFPDLYCEEFLEPAHRTYAAHFAHAMMPPPTFESAIARGREIARGAAYSVLSEFFAPRTDR